MKKSNKFTYLLFLISAIALLSINGYALPNRVLFKTAATGATGLQFDGVDDRVNCGNSGSVSNLGLTGFTLEAWVNLSNPSTINSVIRKSGDYNLYVNNGTLHAEVWTGGLGNPSFRITDGSTPISANTWTHIAATWDGANCKLYVNGVADPASAHSLSISVNENLSLGMSPTFLQPMAGSLDEVRIWNRPQCQSEIQSNRNCGLDPTGQTGLVALYHFDQGFINTDNSLVTTLNDQSGNNNNGTLLGFALTGTSSNWATGTVSGNCTAYSPPGMAGVTGSQVCQSANLLLPGSFYTDGSCNAIARVAASGASPVSGIVNSCVMLDATVQTFNSRPYLQRHYDILPASNAATATGTITLYYGQGEFNAYNLVRGALPALPVNAGDAAGIANIRITQYHGTGTLPGNYTGSAVLINPVDANIVWNGAAGRWEITFDVTGFSGFFLHTSSSNSLLPVRFLSFNGISQRGINHLDWVTADEQHLQAFELQRSDDGSQYKTITSIAPASAANANHYNYDDNLQGNSQGQFFYRLKIVDQDGIYNYSKVIRISQKASVGLSVYPNPVKSGVTVTGLNSSLLGSTIKIVDANGKIVGSYIVKGNGQILDLTAIRPGIYFLQSITGKTLKLLKE